VTARKERTDPKAGAAFGRAGAAFAVLLLAIAVAQERLGAGAPGSPGRVEALMLAQVCGLGAVVLFALRWPPSAAWSLRGALRAVRLYAVFLLGWVPLSMIAYPWLLELLRVPLPAQEALRYFTEPSDTAWGRPLVFAGVCVLGPIVEEILYRGYLRDALRSVLPTGATVVLTALLFGLSHGWLYAFPTFLLGLLFGVLRERHGSLLAPALAHVVHNTTMVATTLLLPSLFHQVFSR
jgi:hypothetical protein